VIAPVNHSALASEHIATSKWRRRRGDTAYQEQLAGRGAGHCHGEVLRQHVQVCSQLSMHDRGQAQECHREPGKVMASIWAGHTWVCTSLI
jgi:hypothetical protein